MGTTLIRRISKGMRVAKVTSRGRLSAFLSPSHRKEVVKIFEKLGKLVFGTPEQRLKSFVQGICKTMVASSTAFEEHYKKKGISMRFYSDYAAQALSTRPGWKEIDQNVFQNKGGKKIVIGSHHSTADVCLFVVLSELADNIGTTNFPGEILSAVLDEYEAIFNSSGEKSMELLFEWKELNQ